MRGSKVIFATLTVAALLAASVSSADARRFRHYGPGPVLGVLGAVVVGAATIATLPFAILADAGHSSPRQPQGYDGEDGYGYGPPPARPPGGYYGQDDYGYGPPQGAYGYGPPPPPPPPRYSRSYGPPPGYYGGYGYGY
jgi:hypothetical protein